VLDEFRFDVLPAEFRLLVPAPPEFVFDIVPPEFVFDIVPPEFEFIEFVFDIVPPEFVFDIVPPEFVFDIVPPEPVGLDEPELVAPVLLLFVAVSPPHA
jgi:hypothetical protein